MNELLHVGVLGMRWGRRRAKQNAFYEKHGMRQPKSNADKYKVIGEKVVSKAKTAKNESVEKIKKLKETTIKDFNDGYESRTLAQRVAVEALFVVGAWTVSKAVGELAGKGVEKLLDTIL